MQCIACPSAYYSRWMPSMEGLQQDELPTEASTDSFRDLLAQTFYELPDAVKQEAITEAPHSKEAATALSGHSDVEQRRDAVSGLTAAGASGQQASHPSSGAGSEQGTSSSHQQQDCASGRGRGRGRRSKRAAGQQETAQQRAHRRFYERKKAKMAALEQEFADKQVEYQRLLRENAELKRKHDALEWTIAGRDEQMSLLQALSSLSLNPNAAQQHSHQPTGMPRAGPAHIAQVPHFCSMPGSHSAPAAHAAAAAAGNLDELHRRAGSAPVPYGQQQQQRVMAAQHAEAAGPFGMVQLLEQEEQPSIHRPAAAAAGSASIQQRQMQQQQAPQFQQRSNPFQQQLLQPPQLQQQFISVQQQRHEQLQQQRRLQASPETPSHLQQQQQQGMPAPDARYFQRSISMPARTSASGEAASPAAAPLTLPGHPVAAAAAAHMHRSYSSSPQAWQGGSSTFTGHAAAAVGPYFAAGQQQQQYQQYQQQQQQRQSAPGSSSSSYHAVVTGWTAGPSRLQQVSTQQQQQQSLQLEGLRSHSWSGANNPGSSAAAAAAVETSPGAYEQPFLAQQQVPQLQQLQQQQRRQQYFRSISMPTRTTDTYLEEGNPAAAAVAPAGPEDPNPGSSRLQPPAAAAAAAASNRRGLFHTITTGGPLPAQQQQQQMQRTGSDPTVYGRMVLPTVIEQQQQQVWQQQMQQLGEDASPFATSFLSQSGLLNPQQQQEQQQLLPQQQLQQQFEQQYGNIQPAQPTEDDLMLIDDDLMLLLEQSLTQKDGLALQTSSGMILSPLPSIPSATGEAAAAALAAAAAEAAQAGRAHPSLAGSSQHQHEQQQQDVGPAERASDQTSAPAVAAGGVGGGGGGSSGGGSPVVNLLHASEQLQLRHEAAGFFPPVAGPAEFYYMHHLVDWYRCKIHQMSTLLPRVDCPVPDASAGVALMQVVEETIMGIRKFSSRNRVGIWELKLINLETGELAEAPITHWRSVLAQLSMSTAQREQPLACYSLFQEYMEKCRQERRAILQDLTDLETRLTGSSGMPAGGLGSPGLRTSDPGQGTGEAQGSAGLNPSLKPDPEAQRVREKYLCPRSLQFRDDGLEEYQSVLEQLQVSMTREHMVGNMLMYSMVQVVTHAQMAKGMVAAYPYWPNGSAIMLLMQEEEAAAAAAKQDRIPRNWREGGPSRLGSI